MKKWAGYLLLMALSVGVPGCGSGETGSELLTETKKAVVPDTESVELPVEETEEGIAIPVYSGDDQAEHLVRQTVYVDEINEQTVMAELARALGLGEGPGVRSLTFGMHGGDRVAMLDMNRAFADYLDRLGTAGEQIVMGSLTNTFLDCYQCDLLMITAEGKVLETSHSIYEEYLEWYPYVEVPYRVKELVLEQGNIRISCPQIEGLSDNGIQGKWNRIFLGAEERTMDEWDASGAYEAGFEVKTMTADVLSILMSGRFYEGDTEQPCVFRYTYTIDLNTGESIRLADYVDVSKVAEDLFAGRGYYVEETLAPYFEERIHVIYENSEMLSRSLEGYDYAEDGNSPYGYSYLKDGKVWICMEVPHDLGDYIEIELEAQQKENRKGAEEE